MNNEMKLIAKELAKMGRNGDTMLAHINPQEAELLKLMGGSGTINPHTGLPEYGWKDIKKAVKSVVKTVTEVVKEVAPVAAVVAVLLVPQIVPALGSTFLNSVGIATTTGSIANVAAGSAILAGTTVELSGGSTEQAAKAAATAALSVGVGGSVANVVGNAVANAGMPVSAANVVASTVGAASSAVATGRDPATAAAEGFAGSAVNIALGGGKPPAPVETRDVTGGGTADVIARTAAEITGTPAGVGTQIAAGPSGTVTDVTAGTTGARKPSWLNLGPNEEVIGSPRTEEDRWITVDVVKTNPNDPSRKIYYKASIDTVTNQVSYGYSFETPATAPDQLPPITIVASKRPPEFGEPGSGSGRAVENVPTGTSATASGAAGGETTFNVPTTPTETITTPTGTITTPTTPVDYTSSALAGLVSPTVGTRVPSPSGVSTVPTTAGIPTTPVSRPAGTTTTATPGTAATPTPAPKPAKAPPVQPKPPTTLLLSELEKTTGGGYQNLAGVGAAGSPSYTFPVKTSFDTISGGGTIPSAPPAAPTATPTAAPQTIDQRYPQQAASGYFIKYPMIYFGDGSVADQMKGGAIVQGPNEAGAQYFKDFTTRFPDDPTLRLPIPPAAPPAATATAPTKTETAGVATAPTRPTDQQVLDLISQPGAGAGLPSGLPSGVPGGIGAGEPGGAPAGLPGGVPEGAPGGVPGGVPGGIAEGVPPVAPTTPTEIPPVAEVAPDVTPEETLPVTEDVAEAIPEEETPEEKAKREQRFGVRRLPIFPSAGSRELSTTGLFGPTDFTTVGVAPIERGRKELLDEESTEDPTGVWGSKTLRGLLGI